MELEYIHFILLLSASHYLVVKYMNRPDSAQQRKA